MRNYITLLVISLLVADCGGKRTSESVPEEFENLMYFTAYGGMNETLDVFAEDGKYFARFAENGKPCEKVSITYRGITNEGGKKCYRFDEMVNGAVYGEFLFENGDFGSGYISYSNKHTPDKTFIIRSKVNRDDIVLDASQIKASETSLAKMKKDKMFIKNFVHLLKTNAASMDYPFQALRKGSEEEFPLLITVSADGLLRIYSQDYYSSEQCISHCIVAQFKSGKEAYVVNDFNIHDVDNDEWFTAHNFGSDCAGEADNVTVKTIMLNNLTYYLIDFDYAEMHRLCLYAINEGQLQPQAKFKRLKQPATDELVCFGRYSYDAAKKQLTVHLEGREETYNWDSDCFR